LQRYVRDEILIDDGIKVLVVDNVIYVPIHVIILPPLASL
jgi:hypothetical protein